MSDLNFRINKDVFYKALQTVNGAVASSSPIPTMSGIEIEATQDMIVLTGSDNDISIRSVIKNDKDNQLFFVEEPGTIVVDHNYILDMVKNLDSDEVQVQNIDGTLTQFTGNNVDFKINGFNPSFHLIHGFQFPFFLYALSNKASNSSGEISAVSGSFDVFSWAAGVALVWGFLFLETR